MRPGKLCVWTTAECSCVRGHYRRVLEGMEGAGIRSSANALSLGNGRGLSVQLHTGTYAVNAPGITPCYRKA